MHCAVCAAIDEVCLHLCIAGAGLETLVALDVLDVHHNRITDAAPVAALTTLRILNLSSNRISTLPQLTALTSLAELNLRRNCLTSLHCGAPGHGRSSSNSGSNGDANSPGGSLWQCSGDRSPDSVPVGDGEGAPTAAASAAGAIVEEGRLGLPQCLQRLFASHNKVSAVGDVPALRALTHLRELALDANPLMNATHEIVRAALNCQHESGRACMQGGVAGGVAALFAKQQ